MDSKEIRLALKAVKESLDHKDYKSAIKQCKTILKLDRNNYLALVFYGAAIQETEQKDEASKAFKRAIEISPNHILAWRGLALFYEKNENLSNSSDLFKVYGKLISLESDFSKFSEAVEKLQNLNNVHYDKTDITILLDLLSSINEEKKLVLQQCLVTILDSNLLEDFIIDYQNLLAELLSIRPCLKNHLDLQKKYFKVLYHQKKFEDIIHESVRILDLYSRDINLLEWICKAYIKLSEINSKQILPNFLPDLIYLKLLEITPDSYLAYYCKGLHQLQTNDFINAIDSLQKAAKLKTSSESVLLKLCQSQILLYRYADAENSCRNALKFIKFNDNNKESLLFFNINLLKSLCEQEEKEKWIEAKNLGLLIFEENPRNLQILKYLSKVYINLKEFTEADKLITKIKEIDQNDFLSDYLECFMLKQNNKLDDYKINLENLVEKIPNNFELWLELGKLYYSKNDKESSIFCLLKAAKLDQWCYWNFLFLGHCYKSMVKDLEKARRCYQKAYQLNPLSAEVGNNLSDVYRILGKAELNSQLLSTTTALNPRSQWAWVKLGLQYLSTNHYQDAMNSLQTAVRLDPDDKNAWEYLGDSYFSLGAYTSAIKSYKKVIELDENSVYAMLQIANTKHLIGQFQESIEEFRIVNAQKKDYIPALRGHAEACLSLMKHYLSENLNGLAQDACQEALTQLLKCLELRRDLICIWKLLGDSCALLSNLPEKYCNCKVDSWLCGDSKKCNDGKTTLNKLQIMKLSCRSYCQAICINSNFSGLWYDLAYIYNCIVQVSKTEQSKKQVRKLACAAVKKSILLDKNSWESWNLYGVILASKEIQNFYLAQHCFIKSIMQLDTNAVTWTNLGTLYLELGDLQLANLSFTEAQKCDHNYVLCWVGQAIIAQITNHHDAMDLYRHSTELGFSSEGCLGYSNLVCQTILHTKNKNDRNYLYSIKNMNAISLVCDNLTWYTDLITTDPWAFNMLGIIYERQMLFKSSADAYKKALELVRLEKITDKNKETYSEVLDKILLNYSRVLSNLKQYDEALCHLKQIEKATFTNQCELAAAYFRAKCYEKAYSTYETTLEWLAPNVEMKSHILVALAAVLYLHQGQEDAKILLMQSCQLKPPSVQGLFACCALGMLHSDLALSELALKELNVYKNDPRYLSDIAVFQSYIFLFKGQHNKAIRALCKVIHSFPDQSSLWLNLSLLLLHLHTSFSSKTAAKCAEVALISGRSSIDVSKVMYLVSLGNLLSGEGVKSLISSQKAVHMFPDVTENWVVLLASILSKCLVQESVQEISWLKKMVTFIRRKFESSKTMTQWLSNNNRKIIMMAEKIGYGCPEIEIEDSFFNLEYYLERKSNF